MKTPRFLVIRRDNIGDLVCTTPLFAGLRQRYTDAWIGVVANSYNAPVLEGNPDIDVVYAYRKAKHGETGPLGAAWDRVRLLAALRREALDYAIVATPADRDRGLAIARLAGAKHVVAFVGHGVNARGVDMPLALEHGNAVSEVELVWRIAHALGVEGPPPATKVIAPRDVADRARATVASRQWRAHGPLIAVHLSARKPSQRWPVERFVELMHALHEREDAGFILFWAPGAESNRQHPGDDDKARAVVDATASLPVLPWPTLELRELIGALAVCDRAVLADGGAMHIAAALGKPLVALFGDSDARRWRPWGIPHEIVQFDSRKVEDIGVGAVLDACARLGSLSPPHC